MNLTRELDTPSLLCAVILRCVGNRKFARDTKRWQPILAMTGRSIIRENLAYTTSMARSMASGPSMASTSSTNASCYNKSARIPRSADAKSC